MERFSIPGAGAIIAKDIDNQASILIQTRVKPDAPCENGLLEIPAGKIRAFESIFDTVKREVREETGLNVVEILGENLSTVYEANAYKVIHFTPFACSQNLSGDYPIMVFVFICKVEGELLPFSEESKNYQWISILALEKIINDSPRSFYPMHLQTLKKYIDSCKQLENAVPS